jgi:Rap1a immunity proteins
MSNGSKGDDKMSKLVLVAVFLLLFCGQAKAQKTGNTVMKMCTPLYEGQKAPENFCLGFIVGAGQMIRLWQEADETWKRKNPLNICIPSEATNGQLIRVFRKYLEGHPEVGHFPAGALFVKALQEAFPCGK